MGTADRLGSWTRRRLPAWADALSYALVIGGLTTVAAFLLTGLTGGDIVRVKLLLFFGGWVLLAVATAKLWPRRGSDETTPKTDTVTEAAPGGKRITRLAAATPPARWVREPIAHEQLSGGGKLFWAAVATLAISFVLETVFGVG